ncbi:hypothetical protein V5098_27195 [Vibrio coralliirubri]|uniref:hypothetical protein n=1 Tax=Vibrio coralliirubri TaxID=1516159 RepID=UPI002FD28700
MTNFNGASRLSKVLVFLSLISKSTLGFEIPDNALESYVGDFSALREKGVVRVLVSYVASTNLADPASISLAG